MNCGASISWERGWFDFVWLNICEVSIAAGLPAKMIDVPLPSKARRIANDFHGADWQQAVHRCVGRGRRQCRYPLQPQLGGGWDAKAPDALNRTTLQLQTLNAAWTGNADTNVAFIQPKAMAIVSQLTFTTGS